MGEIADMMLDGTLDEQTGEYIGPPCGYPRTRVKGQYNTIGKKKQIEAEKKIADIRKELAILINEMKLKDPDKKENIIINEARHIINMKYGKGWRENGWGFK